MRYCLAGMLSILILSHAPAAMAASDNGGIFQLDYFAGSWACEGTSYDLKTGAPTSVTGTWEFTYDCAHGMMVDKFTSSDANAPFTVWGWNAYDSGSQSLTRHETDSTGTWGNSAAGGWGDGMIVWRGSMDTVAYGPYDFTNTITNKAETRFWVDLIARPAGHQRWFDAFKGNCRRGPPWGR